ncbi:TonB-dependent receptor plug domain-containing protein [Candidatus Neomarinimicrobiota bacterium]
MRSNKIIITIVIVLGIVTLSAADIRIDGRIVDAVTGAPVLAANITVTVTEDGTATNAVGYFEFITAQGYPVEIHVSHIAYEDIKLAIVSDTTLVIQLTPRALKGEKIIVTGKRYQPGPDVSAVIETITAEEIENLGARDVGDVLRPLASVTIQATNTGKQFISIRGGNPNEVAVFLDGIRLNDVNTGIADLSAIDLNDMQKVEVIKGGSSMLSGNGAFGGVIKLTTQLPDSNQASLIRGFGTTDPSDQDLAYSASLRKGKFGIGGNHSGKSRRYDGNSIYTTLFNSGSGAIYLESGSLSLKHYELRKFIDLNDGRVVQSDVTNLNHIRYQGSILFSDEWDLFVGRREWSWTDDFFASVTRDFSEESYSGKISHEISNHLGSATLQYDQELQSYNAKHSFAANIVQGVDQRVELNRLNRESQGFAAVLRADSESGSRYLALLRWEASLRMNRLTTKHQLISTRLDPFEQPTRSENLLLDRAVSSFDIIQKYGVRMDGSSRRMDYSLFYNQGHNTRPPSLNDYTLWANSIVSVDEEPPLKSESVATTEIGAELRVRPEKFANVDMEISVNTGIYYNVYDNKITYEYFADRPPEPYNILDTRIRGFEINAGGSIFGRLLHGRVGYRSLSLNDPRVYPNKPAYRYSSQMELRYPWLIIQLDGYYDGPQFVVRNGRRSINRLTRQSVNFNIIYRWNFKQFSMSLSYTIKNILRASEESGDEAMDFGEDPFAYYEQHRQLITLRIKL